MSTSTSSASKLHTFHTVHLSRLQCGDVDVERLGLTQPHQLGEGLLPTDALALLLLPIEPLRLKRLNRPLARRGDADLWEMIGLRLEARLLDFLGVRLEQSLVDRRLESRVGFELRNLLRVARVLAREALLVLLLASDLPSNGDRDISALLARRQRRRPA